MSFLQDVRFGFRMLLKDPAFTVVVIVTLALGIGVNTTVFTLVNAVLFKGLPFERSERIMALTSNNVSKGRDRMGVSYPDYMDWKAQAIKFQSIAAFTGNGIRITDQAGLPEQYGGARITANSFSLIGQKPLFGRDFSPDEEKPNATPVAILGYSVWKNRYGGDSSILGRAIRMNEISTVIIGVMPQGMQFPFNTDAWLPLIPDSDLQNRENRNLQVIGRLTDSATIPESLAELQRLAKNIEKEYPKSNQGIGVAVIPYNDSVNGGRIRAMFLTLLGAVFFVLLIACANVANLLLARSLARAKEISIRSAMGASRLRVVRQLLIESVLMGMIGGLLGLPLALWGIRAFDLATQNVGKPYWIVFKMDYTTFGYFAGICVLTGILFGLAPALHISKLDVNETLKETGRGGGGARMKYLTGAMVVVEVALALVLLVGAGLMIRSFMKMYALDLGVDTRNLVTMRIGLPDTRYKTPEGRQSFHERLLARLNSMPGVESAALASNIPLGGAETRRFEIEGAAPIEFDKRPRLARLIVTPEYFRTGRVKMIRGRDFEDSDGATGKPNVVINQSFAAKNWPGADPLGRRFRFSVEAGKPEQPWLTVIGVCPDITQFDPSRTEPNTAAYIPDRMDPMRGSAILARTRVPPNTLLDAFRGEVRLLDQDLPVISPRTMEQVLIEQRWPFRVFGTLFAIFAAIGLVLSAVGIYAVVSYSVTRRTQEIGIRMALGATAGSVIRLVLTLGVLQLAIGLAIGLGAAFGLTRVLKSILLVSPTDPATFAGIGALLLAVGGIACWTPARKAARIDPMIALRYE